jgi:hypothetical protein
LSITISPCVSLNPTEAKKGRSSGVSPWRYSTTRSATSAAGSSTLASWSDPSTRSNPSSDISAATCWMPNRLVV